MADVILTREQMVAAGLAPTYASIDATDTYYVDNDSGDVFLHFLNTGGSPAVVTFDLTQSVAGAELTDQTVTVPATTGDRMIGPFPGKWEVAGGTHDGRIKFSQDQATGVTVAAVRL